MNWDILNPPRVEIKNAVRVSPMGKPQDLIEKELEKTKLDAYLKQKSEERRKEQIKKAARNRNIRNARRAVLLAEKNLKKKKADLEFLLNAIG